MPSNQLILWHPLLLLPPIFPSIRVFPNESVLHIGWPNVRVSASASVLPMNIQDWFPLEFTGWISLQSRESQESSLTPQFKRITQNSCLENSKDRGAWRATVYGVTKSWTWLNDFHFHFSEDYRLSEALRGLFQRGRGGDIYIYIYNFFLTWEIDVVKHL